MFGCPDGISRNEHSRRLRWERLKSHSPIKRFAPFRSLWPAIVDGIKDNYLQTNLIGRLRSAIQCIGKQNSTKPSALVTFVNCHHGQIDGGDAAGARRMPDYAARHVFLGLK